MTDLKLGQLVADRYSPHKVLGKGLGSTVYLAADVGNDGEHVALKVVGGEQRDEVLREFFERETEILRRIRHPNIIRLLDQGTTGGVGSWLVLEYASGGSLAEPRMHERFRPADELTRLLRDCSSGLLHAHMAGVVHRDLKPSNILFDGERSPKIADFNVSKRIGHATSLNTLSHYMTLRYASPEQRLGKVVDEKADVYSLGLIAAELMLARDIDDVAGVSDAIETSGYGGPLRRIVRRMLTELPERRPGSAEVLHELTELVDASRVLERLHFRLSRRATEQVGEVHGPGTSESAIVRLVDEDLSGPLRVDPERQSGSDGSLTYVFRGQRFSYFVVPITDRPGNEPLLIKGVSLLKPEQREQRRSAAVELEAKAVVAGSRGDLPANTSATLLEDLFAKVEIDRLASRGFDRKRDTLLTRWSTYLEVSKELQAGRERLGEIVSSGYLPDRDMYRFDVRSMSDSDVLRDHPVCYVAADGRPTPIGTVAEQRGATVWVRPHDELPQDRRFATGGLLQLDIRREQVSIDRQASALRAVQSNAGARSDLAELLVRPDRIEPAVRRTIQPLHDKLDDTNRRAVEEALGTPALFLIQGPPGTGKTTVIAELIGQIVQREPTSRILIASQSNVAVDNVLERLMTLTPSLDAVRLGHSDKISDEAQRFELSRQLAGLAKRVGEQATRASARLVRLQQTDVRDIEVLTAELREAIQGESGPDIEAVALLAKDTFGKDAPKDVARLASYLAATAHILSETVSLADIQAIQAEWVDRTKGAQEFEKQLLTEARVIAGTCLGFASSRIAADLSYDWVIIDEAGRASPPEMLVPMVRGERFVLVGDHRQLPPILDDDVLDRVVERLGVDRELLECSLFQDLYEDMPAKARMRLTRQYRMHPLIGEFINKVFYSGELEHGVGSADRPLGEEIFGSALRWIDTSGHGRARESKSGHSFSNKLEVEIIAQELKAIATAARQKGIRPRVGILTAYAAQVRLLETELRSHSSSYDAIHWAVLTVDAAQGKEFEFVLYSTVRSNEAGKIGFLKDVRRLNVALSRARDSLTIVGDRESLAGTSIAGSANPFPSIVQFMQADGQLTPFLPMVEKEYAS